MEQDTRAYVDQEDLARLLDLMREYTSKLREISEQRMELRYRRMQLLLVVMLLGLLIPTALVVLLPAANLSQTSEVLIAAGALVPIVAVVGWITLGSYRRRLSFYDAHQVAITLEHLIRTASQYAEHSTKHLSSRFEFELRVAEGEGALRWYHDVFEGSS